MKFECPHCGQHLEIEPIYGGWKVRCPTCSGEMVVPREVGRSAPPAAGHESESVHGMETLQQTIGHDGATLSAFMAEKQIEGGVQLDDWGDNEAAARGVLAADQRGKYSLGEAIHSGGQGAIFDAKDVNLRRSVAMKVILGQRHATKGRIMRFIEEAQVTAQLQHPGIVPIHELGVDTGGNVFYTMKFVEGRSLKDILDGIRDGDHATIREYPLSHLLTIFQKVCDAVAFAHSRRVIHRDLKPANIMIGEYGEVLAMDWGLAKVLPRKRERKVLIKHKGGEDKQRARRDFVESVRGDVGQNMLQTLDGTLLGTPWFMAPEQAAGETDHIGETTDIYALGGILYNILTLRPPITGEDLREVLKRVVTGRIVNPTVYNRSPGAVRIPSSRGGAGAGRGPQRAESARRATERAAVGAGSSEGASGEDGAPVVLAHCPGGKIPESLSAVAMKALSVDQGRRYQRVKGLQRDVTAYQSGFATSAEAAGLLTLLRLFVGRHRGQAVSLAIIVSLLFIGFGVNVRARIEAEKAQKLTMEKQELAVKKENEARVALAALRGMAPALVAQTAAFMEQHRLDKALESISHAVELVPDKAEYHYLRGNVLQTMLQLAAAGEEYEKALKIDPKHKLAQENMWLCKRILDRYGNLKGGLVSSAWQLYVAMRDQGRYSEASATILRISKDATTVEGLFKSMLQKEGVQFNSLHIDGQGLVTLDLGGTAISDLSPLQGMEIVSLNLFRTPVVDLSPLRGMPLSALVLGSTKVADLSPLQGMQLSLLDISGTPVVDLLPLKGMPLNSLDLQGIKVTDLSPLRGMKSLREIRNFDPLPICFRVLNQALAAHDFTLAEKEANQVAADWHEVSAMARCVEWAKAITENLLAVKAFYEDPDVIPPGAKAFEGRHYLMYPGLMTWEDASDCCKTHGAHLLTVTSKEEYEFVRKLGPEWARYWVGMQVSADGEVQWISNDPVSADTKFALREPDGTLGALVPKEGFHLLTKERKESALPFIVEWDR